MSNDGFLAVTIQQSSRGARYMSDGGRDRRRLRSLRLLVPCGSLFCCYGHGTVVGFRHFARAEATTYCPLLLVGIAIWAIPPSWFFRRWDTLIGKKCALITTTSISSITYHNMVKLAALLPLIVTAPPLLSPALAPMLVTRDRLLC